MADHSSTDVPRGGHQVTTTDRTDRDAAESTIGDHRFTGRPSSAGPLVFVLCFLVLLGGFWLMAVSFDQESGVTFLIGLTLASLAFFIPMARADKQ